MEIKENKKDLLLDGKAISKLQISFA